jgi:hypothetical protein
MVQFSKAYLLADYAEWLIASGAKSEVSRGDLMVESDISQGLDGEPGNDPLTPKVMQDTQIDDCFDHLEYRASAIGNGYLFSVSKDVLASRSPQPAGDASLVYVFLLACGNSVRNPLAYAAFSELCKVALQRLLGIRGTVYNIDAGAADRATIGTDTRKMAHFLAPILGCSPNQEVIDQLAGQGDGGADLAASVGFTDGASGHFSILGQCAASSDEAYWKDKLHQPRRFEALYRWSHSPILAAFVPIVYRSSNGAWISQANVFGAVFFDRLRILQSLQLDTEPLTQALRDQLQAAVDAAKSPAARRPATRKKSGRRVSRRARKTA